MPAPVVLEELASVLTDCAIRKNRANFPTAAPLQQTRVGATSSSQAALLKSAGLVIGLTSSNYVLAGQGFCFQ